MNSIPRFTKIITAMFVVAVALSFGSPARAAYPEDKPVNVLVGFGAGGGNDQVARYFCEMLTKELKQRFYVTNIPGASGGISVNQVVEAKPDGYTLMMIHANISLLKAIGNSPYTYKDMRVLGCVNFDAPGIMVKSDSPYKNLQDFINDAKARPGKINLGVGVPGGIWHLALLNFVNKAGIKVNVVPNTTGGAGVNMRLLGGHIEAAFLSPNENISQMKNKDFRILAFSAPKRLEGFPDVPTFKELGIDSDAFAMRGFYAPKDTPEDVVKILETAIKKVAETQAYKDFNKNTYTNYIYMSGADFAKYLEKELVEYTKIVEDAGMLKK